MRESNFLFFIIVITAWTYLVWVCFFGLDGSVLKGDEVIHVRVAREWASANLPNYPTYFGSPYLEKPGLLLFFTSILVRLFGDSNYVYRLVSAACGMGTILVSALIGFKILRDRWIFAFVPIIAGTSINFLHSHGARTGVQDAGLTFFSSLSLMAMMLSIDDSVWRRQLIMVAGLSSGLAVMCKWYAGLTPWVVASSWFLMLPDFRTFALKNYRYFIASFLLTLLPPLAYSIPAALNHWSLIEETLRRNLVGRLISEGFHNQDNYLLYLNSILNGRWGSPLLIFAGLMVGFYQAIKKNNTRMGMLVLWILTPVACFSFLKSRNSWYILPIFPALVVLQTGFLVTITNLVLRVVKFRLFPGLLLGLCVWLLAGQGVFRFVLNSGAVLPLDRITHELARSPDTFVGFVGFDPVSAFRKGISRRQSLWFLRLRERAVIFDGPRRDAHVPNFSHMFVMKEHINDWRKDLMHFQSIFPISKEDGGNGNEVIAFLFSRKLDPGFPFRTQPTFRASDILGPDHIAGWGAIGEVEKMRLRYSKFPSASLRIRTYPGVFELLGESICLSISGSLRPVEADQRRTVSVLLNGVELGQIQFDHKFRTRQLKIPDPHILLKDNVVTLRDLGQAPTPNTSTNHLGIRAVWLEPKQI